MPVTGRALVSTKGPIQLSLTSKFLSNDFYQILRYVASELGVAATSPFRPGTNERY